MKGTAILERCTRKLVGSVRCGSETAAELLEMTAGHRVATAGENVAMTARLLAVRSARRMRKLLKRLLISRPAPRTFFSRFRNLMTSGDRKSGHRCFFLNRSSF